MVVWMKIVKSEAPGQFFIVGMDVAKDQRLSLTERGMLLTLLSLPPDWDFIVEGMTKILPDGRDRIRTAMNNLKRYGYVRQVQGRREDGSFDSGYIKNTTILTVSEGDDGEIYAGSDGDGIYIIKEDGIEKLGRDEGLTSDVIMRIKKDDLNDIYWIVTSNSIQYMRDGEIKQVTTFPYNNNYDLYFDDWSAWWL